MPGIKDFYEDVVNYSKDWKWLDDWCDAKNPKLENLRSDLAAIAETVGKMKSDKFFEGAFLGRGRSNWAIRYGMEYHVAFHKSSIISNFHPKFGLGFTKGSGYWNWDEAEVRKVVNRYTKDPEVLKRIESFCNLTEAFRTEYAQAHQYFVDRKAKQEREAHSRAGLEKRLAGLQRDLQAYKIEMEKLKTHKHDLKKQVAEVEKELMDLDAQDKLRQAFVPMRRAVDEPSVLK